ncbi:ABC transporter, permease protein [Gleimia coleocanis DSM 15436]|uniref:ABC transporter, permease protein n=1 Tax=Gleimia coleocanis DSM 15436 TaxID=525245 RepID=C0VZG0_9ACTO|nr:sugar ABC transporter permease [Gleimia coleocanis]EEH64261.1 ABC transporter, permease protein [Gleimia coleocanis DSM 15436]
MTQTSHAGASDSTLTQGGHRVDARPESTKGRKPVKNKDGIWPWLFTLPLLTGVAVFYLWPIFQNFWISLHQVSPFGNNAKFVGLNNYTRIFEDDSFSGALVNTLTYTGILLLGIPISVFLAALISRPGLKYASFYRTLYFMPYVAMPAAISIVWRMIYNGDYGILNYFLRSIGVENPPYWLSTPGFALFAVAILGLWTSIGFNMIIISAGLKSIPKELYEAAELDGASHSRQFFSITVPLLTPSIFFLTVIQAIGGFQVFDTLFVLISSRSPALPHTRTIVYLFYEQAFVNNNRGAGAAIAIMILLFVAVVTAIQFWGQKKWVNYV